MLTCTANGLHHPRLSVKQGTISQQMAAMVKLIQIYQQQQQQKQSASLQPRRMLMRLYNTTWD